MGYIVTFAQQKGGAGKTTLLAHLAHSWVNSKKSVALFDLDPQSSLTAWASRSDIPFELLESKDYRAGRDLKEASGNYDYVLVDCPGSATSLLEAALRESDLVLVPCQLSALDVWATGPLLTMAKREKAPARIVLNRVPPRGNFAAAQEALGELGETVLSSQLGNRVAYMNGMATGTTALGLAKHSRAVDEVTALRKETERVLKKVAG
jgi:chromosome partitioning protein